MSKIVLEFNMQRAMNTRRGWGLTRAALKERARYFARMSSVARADACVWQSYGVLGLATKLGLVKELGYPYDPSNGAGNRQSTRTLSV